MKLRLGTILDRIMAVALGSFIFGLFVAVSTQDLGMFGVFTGSIFGLTAALPPFALLWLSRGWSLFSFSLLALPWSFGAYVICDIAGPGIAADVLHWAHESALWWIPYGLLRFLICLIGQAIDHDQAQDNQPA